MRSALFVGVVVLSLPLLASGQASNTNSSGSKPSEQTANAIAEERPAEPANYISAKGFVLEDSTPVRLRLNRQVSSADSHIGDTVDFEVLQDVSVNGTLVIPRGWLAFGTVTKAEPKKRVARGGRVEIKIEYVRLFDSERAPLRAVQGGKGGGHIGAMTAGIAVSGVLFFPAAPFFLLMHGKDITIPKGAEVTAYVNGDVALNIAKFQKSNLPPTQPAAVDSDREPDTVDSAKVPTESSPSGADLKLKGLILAHAYTNEYFSLYYPLPPEWVVETELVRNRLVSEKQLQDANLLLAAVHIPQDTTELRADSSFTLMALNRSGHTNTENCRQYLDELSAGLRASRTAKRKGEMSEYLVAGHEFTRAKFEYWSGPNDRAVICSPARDFLLLWKIEGSYWDSVDEAASTIYAIVPWPRAEPSESSKTLAAVQLSQSDSFSLLRQRVQPAYPAEARENHIQGTVRMQAVISKTGDVETLELLEGPIELAMSAVTAVRQWKYRPYVQNGEPVPVSTVVVVNYSPGAS
jgi:TonB family protein